MAFDLKYILDLEKKLEVMLPITYKQIMKQNNGGTIYLDEDDWELFPIEDKLDKKRISRTCNHVIYETNRANGIDMPTTNNNGNTAAPLSHRGGHPQYIDRVDSQLDDIEGQYTRDEISKTEARKEVSKLQKENKKAILNKEVDSHTSDSGCIIIS